MSSSQQGARAPWDGVTGLPSGVIRGDADIRSLLLPGESELDQGLQRARRLRARLSLAAGYHESEFVGRRYTCMVTLTYRDGVEWQPGHVRAYLAAVRSWWRRTFPQSGRPLRYVWVAELTQRGVMHYHVIFWLPAGVLMPKADVRGWWPHGYTRTEAVRSPVAYVTKYASKVDNVAGFPKGARLYGIAGLRESRPVMRWWALPVWARELFGVRCGAGRVPGGGIGPKYGEARSSPWEVSRVFGRTLVRQRFSYCDRIEGVSGPYCVLPGGGR